MKEEKQVLLCERNNAPLLHENENRLEHMDLNFCETGRTITVNKQVPKTKVPLFASRMSNFKIKLYFTISDYCSTKNL